MSKIIKVTSYVVSILFLTWVIVSYIDIVAHNLSGVTNNSWNLFNIWMARW